MNVFDENHKCEMNPIFHQLYLDLLLKRHTLKQTDDFIKQSNGWAFIIGKGILFVE